MKREKIFFSHRIKKGVGEEATNGDTLTALADVRCRKKISFEFFYDGVVRHALGLGVWTSLKSHLNELQELTHELVKVLESSWGHTKRGRDARSTYE